MSVERKLSQEHINLIKSAIQGQLTKRGFHAVITEMEEVEVGTQHTSIQFETAPFQTTPVIFKSIKVTNFNSSIRTETITNKQEEEIEIQKIWISVHVSYENFDSGHNGTKLFDFSCTAYNLDGKSHVQEINFNG